MKRRRPWLAALADVLVPPLGHVYAGRPGRGVVVSITFLLAGLLSLVLILRVESRALIGALFGLCIACRLAIPADAYVVARQTGVDYRPRRYNRWWVYLLLAAVLVAGGEVAKPFIRRSMQAFRIPAGSMMPTLLIGDHIWVDKAAYGGHDPRRFDVVVVGSPRDAAQTFVKRVIGLPGETVELRNGVVWIDGSPLDEPQMLLASAGTAPANRNYGRLPVRVESGQYFVLGDNRDQSYDSRYWGPVSRTAILGRVHVIYWSWDSPGLRVRWERIGSVVR